MSNLPRLFKALAIEKAGQLVSLQQKTIQKVQADEVLIRVHHASINRMDPGLAQFNAFNFPEPYIRGFDFSGEVVELGIGSDEVPNSFMVGQQVFDI